jgi:hypothetical protein
MSVAGYRLNTVKSEAAYNVRFLGRLNSMQDATFRYVFGR